MKHILVFDVGTTSVKVSLFNQDLATFAHKSVEYTLITQQSGRIEFPAEKYWEAICLGVSTLAKEFPQAMAEIQGITVTTQGETIIAVDHDANPLYNAIVWLDERAKSQAEHINKIISKQEFYTQTGIPDCNEICPVSKLLWFKENEPEIYNKTKYFLLLGDYILYKLTGVFCSEKTLLSTSGYFSLKDDDLWYEILDKIDVDYRKIAPLVCCGDVLGKLTPCAAKELNLSCEAVVVAGAMDQVCGAVGAGNIVSGVLTETTGTALCTGATILRKPINPDGKVNIYRHIFLDSYLALPVSMTAGMVLKWFKDNFCQLETQLAEKTGRDVYDILGEMAALSPPLAKGLFALPYFAGSVQPDYNPTARGAFTQIGLEHTKADFIRAIMEGVAYMLRENIELMQDELGIVPLSVRCLGGGSRSFVWNEIKAQITGLTVDTLKNSECTSIGAAAICAKTLGLFENIGAAVALANPVDKTIEPVSSFNNAYNLAYKKYKQTYTVLNANDK